MSTLETVDVQRVLSHREFFDYCDRMSRISWEKEANFVSCATPGCSFGLLFDIPADFDKCLPIISCPQCRRKTCAKHRIAWHTGKTCTKYDKYLEQKAFNNDKKASKLIQQKCKRCPNCQVAIEKNGGCDHMNCTRVRLYSSKYLFSVVVSFVIYVWPTLIVSILVTRSIKYFASTDERECYYSCHPASFGCSKQRKRSTLQESQNMRMLLCKHIFIELLLFLFFTSTCFFFSNQQNVATRVHSTQQYPFCKNPKIITWGNTETGALGTGSAASRIFADGPITSSVLSGKSVTRIASYYTHSILLANDSKLYSFGDNSFYGALGIGSNAATSATVAIDQTAAVFAGTLASNGVDTFDTGNQFSVVLLANGNIATFGRNDYGQLVCTQIMSLTILGRRI